MDNRQLSLEGEGYFEVVHNQDLPFEIHTHEVDLRVLGTKFNFKNYSDDEEVTVSLLEGKVALHNSLKSMSDLYLSPNEKNGAEQAYGRNGEIESPCREFHVMDKR